MNTRSFHSDNLSCHYSALQQEIDVSFLHTSNGTWTGDGALDAERPVGLWLGRCSRPVRRSGLVVFTVIPMPTHGSRHL